MNALLALVLLCSVSLSAEVWTTGQWMRARFPRRLVRKYGRSSGRHFSWTYPVVVERKVIILNHLVQL